MSYLPSMRPLRPIVLFAATLLAGCRSGPDLQPDESTAASSQELACIAPIVIKSCGAAKCHDSSTHQHGMDLSSGRKIHDAWVNQDGFDHCTNSRRKRVVPFEPDESYVIQKISGYEGCAISQPMPPPPRAPLEPAEVEALRTWVANGARLDCQVGVRAPEPGGGGDASAGSPVSDASGPSGVADTSGLDAGSSSEPTTGIACSASEPCPANHSCLGDNCAAEWECIAHFATLHDCSQDPAPYCGCDGVTFEAPLTCPNRPYQHAGACGEGYNCDVQYDITCDAAPPPACPVGETRSVVDGCFGECVPSTSCRCERPWDCPLDYACDEGTRYCISEFGGAP